MQQIEANDTLNIKEEFIKNQPHKPSILYSNTHYKGENNQLLFNGMQYTRCTDTIHIYTSHLFTVLSNQYTTPISAYSTCIAPNEKYESNKKDIELVVGKTETPCPVSVIDKTPSPTRCTYVEHILDIFDKEITTMVNNQHTNCLI